MVEEATHVGDVYCLCDEADQMSQGPSMDQKPIHIAGVFCVFNFRVAEGPEFVPDHNNN